MTVVPRTTTPVIAAGALAAEDQPDLIVDDELQLRPWAASDAARLRVIYADPFIARWHARTLESQAEATELAMGWRQGWATETEASWAVVSESDRIVGRVALKHLDLHEAVAELAYWIAPEARGAGIAARSVEVVTDWAFAAGFHRLQLEHSTANLASCRVAVKSGFVAEGTRRSAALHADGWHDMHLHARHRVRDDPRHGNSDHR